MHALVMRFGLEDNAQKMVRLGLKRAADLDYLDDVCQNPKCTLDLVTEAKLKRLKAAWLEQRQSGPSGQGAAAAPAPPAALEPSRGCVGGRAHHHPAPRLPAPGLAVRWRPAGRPLCTGLAAAGLAAARSDASWLAGQIWAGW